MERCVGSEACVWDGPVAGRLAGSNDASWRLVLGIVDIDELEEARAIWEGSEKI
jgi:hypothetical protein